MEAQTDCCAPLPLEDVIKSDLFRAAHLYVGRSNVFFFCIVITASEKRYLQECTREFYEDGEEGGNLISNTQFSHVLSI